MFAQRITIWSRATSLKELNGLMPRDSTCTAAIVPSVNSLSNVKAMESLSVHMSVRDANLKVVKRKTLSDAVFVTIQTVSRRPSRGMIPVVPIKDPVGQESDNTLYCTSA